MPSTLDVSSTLSAQKKRNSTTRALRGSSLASSSTASSAATTFVVARDGKVRDFIEVDLGRVPASLGPDAGAGPVDRDTAHDICCNRKEMRAVIPVDFGRTDE